MVRAQSDHMERHSQGVTKVTIIIQRTLYNDTVHTTLSILMGPD